MKKLILSSMVAISLATTSIYAGESNNGAFVGLNLGGSITGAISSGSKNPSLNSSLAVGFKGGYQAYFSEQMGARFYLSSIANFGLLGIVATGGTSGDGGMSVNLSVMADLNGDFLFDFINENTFSTGVYTGFFGGALLNGISLYKVGGAPAPEFSVATTLGLNIGSRTSVNEHHEFDIGAKIGMAINVANKATSVGPAIYIGSSYSYKF